MIDEIYRIIESKSPFYEGLIYIKGLGADHFIFKNNQYFSLFFFYNNYLYELNIANKSVWWVAIGKAPDPDPFKEIIFENIKHSRLRGRKPTELDDFFINLMKDHLNI